MGFLDNCTPFASKTLIASVWLGVGAIFVAMCASAPAGPFVGDGEDLSVIDNGDTAWILASTAIVLLMTPGVCFLYCGMGHHKNVVSTIMQALLPMAIIPIVFTVLGYSLSFAPSVNSGGGIFGNPAYYAMGFNIGATPHQLFPTVPGTVYFMFEVVFAVITPSIIIGSIADRVNCSALCIFITLWHLVVYCPLAHMVWYPTGLIKMFGVLDYAGGSVVHMASGWAALVAAIYIGKNNEDHEIFGGNREPANVPFVVLGTGILWMGWFGFNAGSAATANAYAGQVFLTTNAAASSAMFAWVMLDLFKGRKMSCVGACVGAIIGLVAITPCAGYVNIGGAYLVGMLGSSICSGAQSLWQKYGHKYVTDTAEVFVCHGLGGTAGMLLTSLFATTKVCPTAVDGAFYGNGMLLAKTLAVCVLIIIYICSFTLGCLWVTDQILTLRVSDEDIQVGLDVSRHGERAISVNSYLKELKVHMDSSVHGKGSSMAPVIAPRDVQQV